MQSETKLRENSNMKKMKASLKFDDLCPHNIYRRGWGLPLDIEIFFELQMIRDMFVVEIEDELEMIF